MAVGRRLSFTNLNLADYDKVCEALNFPGDWPRGVPREVVLHRDIRGQGSSLTRSSRQSDGPACRGDCTLDRDSRCSM